VRCDRLPAGWRQRYFLCRKSSFLNVLIDGDFQLISWREDAGIRGMLGKVDED
jgi:hypothetical protein